LGSRPRNLGLHVLVLPLSDFHGLRGREDQFTPAGGESVAAAALAGLHDDGMPLGRARHRERTARVEPFSLVVQAVDLRRICEYAPLLVEDDRIVLPGLPVAGDDLHELVGAIIARVVLEVLLLAEVRRLRVVQRGDDVPRSTPADHEVERREHAGHMIWLVVGGRVGAAEAELGRRHPHGGEDGDQVHLHHADAILDRRPVVILVHVGHRQTVVEERHMELGVLQYARDALIVFGAGEVGHRLGMPPRRHIVRAVLRLEKGDQGQVGGIRRSGHLSRPCAHAVLRRVRLE